MTLALMNNDTLRFSNIAFFPLSKLYNQINVDCMITAAVRLPLLVLVTESNHLQLAFYLLFKNFTGHYKTNIMLCAI